ncbi:LysR family transcriptional regulator [Priestia filamentosa]|uniref:LysR family transcriptional regulator n=1 Tax=Priestia filamentosa TaxID=1402861 RepID=UPI0002DA1454|nr:LysR family transcriptional regulator [Priestia filamentosa]
MDDKDWISIKILSEEKHITHAAERLYISQPSLTYRLRNIEKEFGVKLFFKIKGGIEFTDEGLYLVNYAEEMLERLQQAKDNVLNMQNEVKGTLRLGVSSNFAQYKLPEILKKFSLNYPYVQFDVNTGWSTDIIDMLPSSSVQVGIVRGNYKWEGEKYLLNKERVCLISKGEIDISKLPQLPFINYKTDPSLKNQINNWWNDRFSRPPSITMETDKKETCKEMVKNGLGISILPEICLQPSDNLYKYNLSYKNGELLFRSTWLMYNGDHLNLSTVKHFVNFLKDNAIN